MHLESFFENSRRILCHSSGKNTTSRPLNRLLKGVALTSIMLVNAACVSTSNDSHFSSGELDDIRDSFQDEQFSNSENFNINFLSPRSYDRYRHDGASEKAVHSKLVQDFGAAIQDNAGEVVLRHLQLGGPAAYPLLNTANNSKIETCVIIPAGKSDMHELLRSHSEPHTYEHLTSKISFERGEFETFAVFHEMWHCVFFEAFEDLKFKKKMGLDDLAPIYNFTESLSDVAAAITAIQQGYNDIIPKMRDLRNVESTTAFLSNNLNAAIGHYTVRSLDELEQRLSSMSVDEINALRGEKLKEFSLDIVKETKLNKQELASFKVFLIQKPFDTDKWLERYPQHRVIEGPISNYLDSLENTLTKLNSAQKENFMFGRPKGRPRRDKVASETNTPPTITHMDRRS